MTTVNTSRKASILCVLHTTEATVGMMRTLTDELLPGVTVYHLLDDSMLRRINARGTITDDVCEQFNSLVLHAARLCPDALLCACSSVGELAENARALAPFPIARIDEPMAIRVANTPGSCCVAATVASTLEPTMRLIARCGKPAGEIAPLLIRDAGALLMTGQLAQYRALLAQRLSEAARCCDRVVLAQASMADALPLIAPPLREKFLTSPRSGVEAVQMFLR